jgi:hypothetical protein
MTGACQRIARGSDFRIRRQGEVDYILDHVAQIDQVLRSAAEPAGSRHARVVRGLVLQRHPLTVVVGGPVAGSGRCGLGAGVRGAISTSA